MLNSIDAQPTLAVKSLMRSRSFYEGVLGLRPVGPAMPTVQCYLAGRTVLVVYESEFAGTNKATAVTWPLGQTFPSIIADLKRKGASFAHYEIPGMTREGDVHVGHGRRLAWLTDPDGNIIHLGDFGGD
ncbi:MAG TPA: VOC family protein [Steroidobacteraceae bacterium]|nr:VOC family protein [Steroidobacteraceae bacterium]